MSKKLCYAFVCMSVLSSPAIAMRATDEPQLSWREISRNSRDAFFSAIADKNMAVVTDLIGQYPHIVDAENDEGMTALFFAVRLGVVKVVRELISKGTGWCHRDLYGHILENFPILNFAEARREEVKNSRCIHECHDPAVILLRRREHGKLVEKLTKKYNKIIDILKVAIHPIMGKERILKCLRSGSPDVMSLSAEDLVFVGELIDSHPEIAVFRDCAGCTFLYAAVTWRDVALAEKLIDKGADVNVIGTGGVSPLGLAFLRGDNNVVQLLFNRGARLNPTSESEMIRAFMCAATGDPGALNAVLKVDDDAIIKKYADVVLSFALGSGHDEVINAFLAKGADINARNENGNTCLHGAVITCNPEMVKKILAIEGVDINVKNNDGKSPLDVLEKFWESRDGEWGAKFVEIKGLLTEAMKEAENRALVKGCVSAIDRGDGDDIGRTIHDRPDIIKIADNSKVALLHMAIREGNSEIVGKLIDAGANVDAADGEGRTPLHLAVETKNIHMVTFLIEKGARFNGCNELYSKAISLAIAFDVKNFALVEAVNMGLPQLKSFNRPF